MLYIFFIFSNKKIDIHNPWSTICSKISLVIAIRSYEISTKSSESTNTVLPLEEECNVTNLRCKFRVAKMLHFSGQ